MASEYLLKKARESYKPEEIRELTPSEKRRNWWHYYKWHVTIGTVLMLCLANILGNAFGIGKTEPDVSVAWVGKSTLREETANALREGLAALCTDLNGDGKTVVEIQQYTTPDTGDSDTLLYAQAAQVQLIADITECKSYFFLMENPDAVQRDTASLRNLDGSLPADGDTSADGKYLLVRDCPALLAMNLGEEAGQLAFARRGFWSEKTVPNVQGCDALWEVLTEGA